MERIDFMRIFRMIIIGILIALSSSYILVTISILSDANITISGAELRYQIIIATLLGAAIGPLSLLFNTERLPFIAQLIVHFISVTLFVFTAGHFGDWFVHFGMKNVFVSEVIIYTIVWSTLYMLEKRDIEQINAAIQKRKGRPK